MTHRRHAEAARITGHGQLHPVQGHRREHGCLAALQHDPASGDQARLEVVEQAPVLGRAVGGFEALLERIAGSIAVTQAHVHLVVGKSITQGVLAIEVGLVAGQERLHALDQTTFAVGACCALEIGDRLQRLACDRAVAAGQEQLGGLAHALAIAGRCNTLVASPSQEGTTQGLLGARPQGGMFAGPMKGVAQRVDRGIAAAGAVGPGQVHPGSLDGLAGEDVVLGSLLELTRGLGAHRGAVIGRKEALPEAQRVLNLAQLGAW